MADLIDRQAAIDAMNEVSEHYTEKGREWHPHINFMVEAIKDLPSAQPDTSRIENILHGKSAEEQYDFLWWLMQNYGMQFTDTRIAVIEWLRGERNG